ncbi:MAG: recombinase family protein [Endomicrobium sp.]|nr:recombinase family protein [Endomicrobium sp.]
MKAVILSRVSSLEQEDGKSLKAQMENAEKYAKNKGLNVIKTFTLVESSTRGGRKKFYEMIEFVKSQKEPIAIIADTVDRFQRRFDESVYLKPLIADGKIELHFVSNGLVINKDSKGSDHMMWSFNVVGAEAFIYQLREATKRGVMQKLKDGEIASKAPIGYKNVVDPLNRNKRTVIIDEVRAPIVKKLFKDYATGLYPLDEIARKAKKYGLQTDKGQYFQRNSIHRMLTNTFYTGMMSFKGILYPHKYETLIDKATFDKCSEVRTRLKKKPVKYASKPFIFRNILKCAFCGSTITSEIQKGRYIYLACHTCRKKRNPAQERVTEEKLLGQLQNILSDISLPEELQTALIKDIEIIENVEFEQSNKQSYDIQRKFKQIESDLDRLLELLIKKSITEEQYNRKYTDLIHQKNDLTAISKDLYTDYDEVKLSANIVCELSRNAAMLFKSSNIEEKQKILNLITSNLKLKNKMVDFSYRKPFDVINNLQNQTIGVDDET